MTIPVEAECKKVETDTLQCIQDMKPDVPKLMALIREKQNGLDGWRKFMHKVVRSKKPSEVVKLKDTLMSRTRIMQ
jgi:hypothetical protein